MGAHSRGDVLHARHRVEAGVDDRAVRAGAAVDRVGRPLGDVEAVVAVAAEERRRRARPGELRDERVGAALAVGVVVVPAVDDQSVLAASAVDDVVARAVGQLVGSVPARELVVAGVAADPVAAGVHRGAGAVPAREAHDVVAAAGQDVPGRRRSDAGEIIVLIGVSGRRRWRLRRSCPDRRCRRSGRSAPSRPSPRRSRSRSCRPSPASRPGRTARRAGSSPMPDARVLPVITMVSVLCTVAPPQPLELLAPMAFPLR